MVILEGLVREGLPVVTGAGSAVQLDGSRASARIELLIKGVAGVWDVSVPDPRFRYARWCSDLTITDVTSRRVLGGLSLSGREGHLTGTEARARRVRAMQREMTRPVGKNDSGCWETGRCTSLW